MHVKNVFKLLQHDPKQSAEKKPKAFSPGTAGPDRAKGKSVVGRIERHDAKFERHIEVQILQPGINDPAFHDHFARQFDIAKQEGDKIGRAFIGAGAGPFIRGLGQETLRGPRP